MRLIAKLEIKNKHVVKGINFEGFRKVGDPLDLANQYYKEGIDEIIFVDTVASLYERNHLFELIKDVTKNIFIPITVCGGIRSLKDIETALNSGADKVAVNTAIFNKNFLLAEACKHFGSSTIVSNVEAKEISNNKWEPYKNFGRDKTGWELQDWVKSLQDSGVGEILLTSVDQDGTKKGFDLNLLNKIIHIVNVPLIISGGCGNLKHIEELKNFFFDKEVSIGIASCLHYNLTKIIEIKNILK